MKNILIVDGYNVIGQSAVLRDKRSASLERARMGLANLILTWNRSHGSYECLVVFDGRDPVGPHSPRSIIGGVNCLFTRTKTEADDEIIRIVKESRQGASQITVVSDDNYVRNNCRAHGACVEPASFFDKGNNPGRKKGPADRSGASEKNLDHKTISDVNKEQRERFGL